MSSLEALIASSGEQNLLEQLSFDLPAASSAIVDRKTLVRSYPTSASTISPTGNRTCRLRLGGDGWCDTSSVRLVYTLTNTDASKPLSPASGPWCPISLLRESSSGVETCNIPSYNRFHELHGFRLTSQENKFTEAMYGWGGSWSGGAHPTQGVILPNASIQVSFKPLTTIFTSGKIIPCRWMPTELEITAAPASEWCNLTVTLPGAGSPVDASQSYTISSIQLLYSSISLDEAVS